MFAHALDMKLLENSCAGKASRKGQGQYDSARALACDFGQDKDEACEKQDYSRRRKRPENPRLVPKMNPPIIDRSVCPTSIIVSRNPVEVPTSLFGASSVIKAGVAAVAVAKPNPYINDRSSRVGKLEKYGIATSGIEEIIKPAIIGFRLPTLSESLPM